ncbi:hypothetical protein L9F63_005521 [Diploptera punctata]|uniref:tRNA pseudouridine(55) synthase n=1 Tax=Diploptera punctata TaxID=6984 RepID=A0AAD7ZDC6_DIPPU|nr:hypothetical protein L9F63_005521 [Diploptera punctata]
MALGIIHNENEIYENLRSLSCCKRCCLRYLGERDSSSYINVNETLKQKGLESDKEDDYEPEHKIFKPNPCISFVRKIYAIITDVLTASYDCDIFTCALSLPISYQLRSHSLWLHLMDKFPVPFESEDLHQETHVISVKEAWKWTIAPVIAKAINKELDSGVNSDFFVGINVSYTGDEYECSCLLEMHADIFKIRKTQKRKYHGNLYTRKALFMIMSPCSHNSIFIAGRYNKFSRMLSQTPWVIDGERRMESSVQEIICESLQTVSRSEGVKFSASGREDVDVRTLGRGRPFVCELVNPHRMKFTFEQVQNLQTNINKNSSDVAVRDLQFVNKDELGNLKTGEEKKMKRYMALCICNAHIKSEVLERLSSMKDITLNQKTPIRVLHRRPLATRSRVVHSMRAWMLENPTKVCKKEGVTLFKLDIKTQAGTYIKEFIHGDFGRTQPSLGHLLDGVSVDILALDVEDIELDWPPAVNYLHG